MTFYGFSGQKSDKSGYTSMMLDYLATLTTIILI